MQSVTRHSRTHHAVSPVTMANKSCTISCNQSHDNPCNQSRDIRKHIMQSGTRHSCMWVSSHAIILSSFLILTTSHSREIQTNNHNNYMIYNCWGIALELRHGSCITPTVSCHKQNCTSKCPSLFLLPFPKIDFFLFHIFTSFVSSSHSFDSKYGLHLFHLLRTIQCILSQTHSLPFRLLFQIRMQSLLSDFPLWRWRLRSQVPLLQHSIHSFTTSTRRPHKVLPHWRLRKASTRHPIRSRTSHASCRSGRTQPWQTSRQSWFSNQGCSDSNQDTHRPQKWPPSHSQTIGRTTRLWKLHSSLRWFRLQWIPPAGKVSFCLPFLFLYQHYVCTTNHETHQVQTRPKNATPA